LRHHSRAVNSVALSIILCCTLILMAGPLTGQQSSGESKSPQKFSASSIQIELPDPGDVPLPTEFRIAVYENLIRQIEKTGKFQHVYRSGDKDAVTVPDLVTLRTKARAFTDHAGQSIVDRDIKGRVLMMGENIGATYDFSKKVAKIIRDTF